jgi:hypothetical protein
VVAVVAWVVAVAALADSPPVAAHQFRALWPDRKTPVKSRR